MRGGCAAGPDARSTTGFAHCSLAPAGPASDGAPSARRRPSAMASSAASASSTCSMGTDRPSSRWRLVTPFPRMPQGIISSNHREVGVHVERQAVGGHTAPDPDADGGELALVVDPHPGEAIHASCADVEARRGGDDGGLEGPHVAAQVERIVKLDDRIGDELPGSMKGDVTTAVDAQVRGAQLAQALGSGQEVRLVAPAPDGVHREVLQEQEAIADAPLASLLARARPGAPTWVGRGPFPAARR